MRHIAILLLLAASPALAAPEPGPRPSIPGLRPSGQAPADWSYAPKGWEFNIEDLPLYKRRGKLVPLAEPGPGTADIATCMAELKANAYCRMGDIVVISAGKSLSRAGRCERDPADTKAYAIPWQSWNMLLGLLQQQSEVEDSYQTYIFFTNFKQTNSASVPPNETQGCPLAWHMELSHNGKQIMNIKGVGRPYNPQPPGENLHAIMNMWSIHDWTEEELRDTGSDVKPLNIVAHETEHDVCCYVDYIDPETGTASSRLIGQQGAHWSLYHNTYGQLMYGCNWRDEGNGTFYSIPPLRGTRPLDLYLWGLIPSSQVPPVFVIDTKTETCTPKQQTLDAIAKDCPDKQLDEFDLCLDPPYYRLIDGSCTPYTGAEVQSPAYITATGKRKNVTIDNILAANGQRDPDYTQSVKTNTQLFVLITGADETGQIMPFTQTTLDRLNRLRRDYNRHIYHLTGHRLRNLNSFDAADDSPLWEWGGAPEWDGESELEGWEATNLAKPLGLKGGQLELHLKGKDSGMTHTGLRLVGRDYDTLQVVLTVPKPADGKARLLHGEIVLKGDSSERQIAFPVYADGREKTVAVHAPHKLLKQEACSASRCIAVCRYANAKEAALKAKQGWYLSCPGDTGEEEERVIKAGQCQNEDGTTACGPYCTGPKTDVTLDSTAVEGWYDSCENQLDGTYHTLTLLPVTDDDAGSLKGPVLVDRIDIYRAQEMLDEEHEAKKKDGEKDWDGDGLVNAFDNCPQVANPDQIDSNEDEEGDACGDFDADGILNALDNCPTTVNSLQQDDDGDAVGDACDPDYDSGGCSITGATRLALAWPLLAFLAFVLLIRRRQS